MQRVTISIDDRLADELDAFLTSRGYQNRSEAYRDILRETVERWRQEGSTSTHCVGVLSYIFNPEQRDLALRLAALLHANHDLIMAQTQTPLDHDYSLASLMLKGPTEKVRSLADGIRAERGVRFGAVNLIAVEPADTHAHAPHHDHAGHAHLSPRLG